MLQILSSPIFLQTTASIPSPVSNMNSTTQYYNVVFGIHGSSHRIYPGHLKPMGGDNTLLTPVGFGESSVGHHMVDRWTHNTDTYWYNSMRVRNAIDAIILFLNNHDVAMFYHKEKCYDGKTTGSHYHAVSSSRSTYVQGMYKKLYKGLRAIGGYYKCFRIRSVNAAFTEMRCQPGHFIGTNKEMYLNYYNMCLDEKPSDKPKDVVVKNFSLSMCSDEETSDKPKDGIVKNFSLSMCSGEESVDKPNDAIVKNYVLL